MQDWKQVETLCAYLKPLFDTANLLTTPTMPTASTFFPEASNINLQLARAAGASDDDKITALNVLVQEKFDKYWRSCFLVLATATVLDPRFKLKLVEFRFSKIYGEEGASYVKLVDEGIHELFPEYTEVNKLFLEYVGPNLPLTSTRGEEASGATVKPEDRIGLSSNGLGLLDFDLYILESASHQPRSGLDQNLKEFLLVCQLPDSDL